MLRENKEDLFLQRINKVSVVEGIVFGYLL